MRARRNRLLTWIAVVMLSLTTLGVSAQPIAKVQISQRGIVAVTALDLHRAGVTPGDLSVDEIAVTVLGHRTASTVEDLNDNGLFDGADRIVFFGQRLRGENVHRYRYADQSTYLIERIEPDSPRETSPRPEFLGPTHARPASESLSLQRHVHIEEDLRWTQFSVPRANDTDFSFMGEFSPLKIAERTFRFDAPGLDRTSDDPFTLSLRMFGRSTQRSRQIGVPDHLLSVHLNDHRLSDIAFDGRRGFNTEYTLASPEILRPSNNELTIALIPRDEVPVDVCLIDWLEVQWPSTAAMFSNQGEFAIASPTSGERVTIAGLSGSNVHLICLTTDETIEPTVTLRRRSGFHRAIFETTCANGLYAIATDTHLLRPDSVEPFAPEMTLHPESGAEYLIITHPNFREAAERLAAYRRTNDGLTATVVEIQDVYDLFNHGVPHFSAIPAALRHIWKIWPAPRLRYVVLMGDASWDWHQMESDERTYIPTQYFSGHTIQYASDNEFTFLTEEPYPTVAIGRLPVSTADEARSVVDKLIAYDDSLVTSNSESNWRNRILFAASPGQTYHDFLDTTVDNHLEGNFDVVRAYASDDSPLDCTQAIIDTVNEGVAFLSFVGHGSRYAWQSGMRLAGRREDYRTNFNPSMIEELTNTERLPLVLGITCFTNNFDNPDPRNCIGEALLLHPTGGAIASVATSSYSFVRNDLRYCGKLFDTLFEESPERIGDLLLQTVRRDGVLHADRLSFILLGDPATPLPLVSQGEGSSITEPSPPVSPQPAASDQ